MTYMSSRHVLKTVLVEFTHVTYLKIEGRFRGAGLTNYTLVRLIEEFNLVACDTPYGRGRGGSRGAWLTNHTLVHVIGWHVLNLVTAAVVPDLQDVLLTPRGRQYVAVLVVDVDAVPADVRPIDMPTR